MWCQLELDGLSAVPYGPRPVRGGGGTSFLLAPTAPAPRLRSNAVENGRSSKGKEVITQMMLVQNWLQSLLDREEGQGLAEYALILALIAIIAIAALIFLGTQISSILAQIGKQI